MNTRTYDFSIDWNNLNQHSESRLCIGCRHCRWDDIGGTQIPSCQNPETKLFDPPIYFLEPTDIACQFFAPRPPTLTVIGGVREKLTQKPNPPLLSMLQAHAHTVAGVAELIIGLIFVVEVLRQAMRNFGMD